MTSTVTSREGQTLDDIVFENFGFARHMLASVTAANPHALKFGVKLPAGILINLPAEIETPSRAEIINLWD